MKKLKISKRLIGFEQLFNSEEVKAIFEPYESRAIHQKRKTLETISRGGKMGIVGYVVEVDPETNYNKPFKVYYMFTTKTDNVTFINEMEAGGTICNGKLRQAMVTMDEIVLTDTFFENDYDNRKSISENRMIVTKIS